MRGSLKPSIEIQRFGASCQKSPNNSRLQLESLALNGTE
jgi:hypothetical protein